MGPMALPLSIAAGVLSAGAGIMGQQQAQKDQLAQQARATEAEIDRVAQQQNSVRVKERQQQLEAAQKLAQNSKSLAEARATADVAASESGIAGRTVDLISSSMTATAANYANSIEQNLKIAEVNRQTTFDNIGAQFASNFININQPVAAVDYLGNIAGGLSTGMSLYGTTSDMSNPFKKPVASSSAGAHGPKV